MVGVLSACICYPCNPFEKFANKIGRTISDRTFVKSFEHHLMLNSHDNLRDPIRVLLDELKVAYQEQLVDDLNDILIGSIATQIAYPDTMETLERLKSKYGLVLLTNSFKQGYEGLVGKFGIDKIFSCIITSFEIHYIKPELEPFKAAIAIANCDPSEIVVVGDNLYDDIQPAQSVGMKAILLDRKGRYSDFKDRITTLDNLQEAIDHID